VVHVTTNKGIPKSRSPYDKIHPIQAMLTLLSTQIQHISFTNTAVVHHITHMCLFLTVPAILGWNDCPEW